MNSTDLSDTSWFKSTFSKDANSCVEVRFVGELIQVRDSKYLGPEAEQPIITMPATEWATVLDLSWSRTTGAAGVGVSVTVHSDGGAVISSGTTRLSYDSDEWDAFTKGVADGQFTRC